MDFSGDSIFRSVIPSFTLFGEPWNYTYLSKASLTEASHFVSIVTIRKRIKKEVPRDGIEPPTRGFSERPRAMPPPFVEALFYLYVFNIKTILIITHLSWSELK